MAQGCRDLCFPKATPHRSHMTKSSGAVQKVRPTVWMQGVRCALTRPRLWMHEEIIAHDKEPERAVTERAADLVASLGIATLTVAEMLILVGDDPTRIRSEAAFATLWGVCPIPASSGKTQRFLLNRGGNRQANAAFYRLAIVRMRSHESTLAYVKNAQETVRAKVRSCAAQSATSSAKSTARSACLNQPSLQLDEYRSFNAAVETFAKTRLRGDYGYSAAGGGKADIHA